MEFPFVKSMDAREFDTEIATVLKSKPIGTDMLNVMDVLGYDQTDFQKAFDVALAMENRNLVKLLYSNFNARKVIIEFTLLAK